MKSTPFLLALLVCLISWAVEAQEIQATVTINTVNKKAGRIVFDATNTRLLYAAGAGATAAWHQTSDNLAVITPA